MQASIANVFKEASASNQFTTSSIEVHLVDTNDIFYKRGRLLAEKVYHEVWNTEHLIDGNDYAVVISLEGEVIGNMNLQVRSPQKLLKSEKFFGREHWKYNFDEYNLPIAEISAFAISRHLSLDLSRLVMMSLIAGMQNICRLEAIKLIVTVQHESLMRILKSLHLPFHKNQMVTIPQGNLPDDDYWNRQKAPGLYYIQPLSLEVVECCYSYLVYMTLKGVSTAFLPRTQKADLSYSTFRKSWTHNQQAFVLS
ncbi:hypothetical protein [Gloeothece verrucosa]|uniref:Uncharacterized protein n=1 Tax=Gloeothece verrucosa (strain PCC 7822) TaxID=497965 RepID=E0UH35_GLOV7|nr:hypothetical protein [Gloeothece verrucosa]ADN15634.1 conserved hypothetical protein [Gloeothece verrucosa PCC 7822]